MVLVSAHYLKLEAHLLGAAYREHSPSLLQRPTTQNCSRNLLWASDEIHKSSAQLKCTAAIITVPSKHQNSLVQWHKTWIHTCTVLYTIAGDTCTCRYYRATEQQQLIPATYKPVYCVLWQDDELTCYNKQPDEEAAQHIGLERILTQLAELWTEQYVSHYSTLTFTL